MISGTPRSIDYKEPMRADLRRILICSNQLFPPQSYGGAQSSIQQLCLKLRERNYETSLLCRLSLRGLFGRKHGVYRKLLRRDYSTDSYGGLAKVRCWNVLDHAAVMVDRFRPDLVIADAGNTMAIARRFVDLGLPTIAMIRDVEFGKAGDDFFKHGLLRYAANSTFTSTMLDQTFGIDATVIHPLIDREAYRSSVGEHVLHINTDRRKGIDTTLRLAELRPDIKFVIYDAWQVNKNLRERYRGVPNVDFRRPLDDGRRVYSGAKVLLVPSVWQEAWGRVVSEAQVSGIPVIARAVGGVPESVGKGGLLLPPEASIDVWLEALSRLWDDREYWSELSRAALEHAERPEMDPSHLADRWVTMVEEHIDANAGMP
jgi:glycosyltransferase involved in cell wall biosynthesis